MIKVDQAVSANTNGGGGVSTLPDINRCTVQWPDRRRDEPEHSSSPPHSQFPFFLKRGAVFLYPSAVLLRIMVLFLLFFLPRSGIFAQESPSSLPTDSQAGQSAWLEEINRLSFQLKEDPLNSDARFRRGYLYYELGNYGAAVKDFSQAIKFNPTGSLYFWRGAAYYHLQQDKLAVADFSRALEIDPVHAKSYYSWRARSYIYLGKWLPALHDAALGSGVLILVRNLAVILSGSFILSLLFSRVILGYKKGDPKRRYWFFLKTTQIIWLVVLLALLVVLQTTAFFSPLFDFLDLLFPDSTFLFLLGYIFFFSLVIYLFTLVQRTIPGYFVEKSMKQTTITFSRYLKLSSLLFIRLFLIQFAVISYKLFMNYFQGKGLLEKGVSIFSVALLVMLFLLFYPRLIALFYGVRKEQTAIIRKQWQGLFKKANIKLGKISVLKTSDLKMANAWVAGLWNHHIYITDYLLYHTAPRESEAVIAHELGHIKKGHLWVNYLLILTYFFSSGYVEGFFNHSVIATVVYLAFYFGFFYTFIRRKQEYAADRYVAEIHDQPEAFIQALEKLSGLSFFPLAMKRRDEKIMTHPSLHRRVLAFRKLLEQKGDLSLTADSKEP